MMTDKEKHHKACDECRIRKLKCPGEYPACSRCVRDGVPCVYSLQKTMGRPRKRRRSDALRAHQAATIGKGETNNYISISAGDSTNGHNTTNQWLEGNNVFMGDESRLLDLNILGSGDGHNHHVGGCIPHTTNRSSSNNGHFDPSLAGSSDTVTTDLDTLFDPSAQNIDFSSLLSDLSPSQDSPLPNPSTPSSCSAPHVAHHLHCTNASSQPVLSNLIDHTKIPLEVGTAMSPRDMTAFGINPETSLGLTCDCLLHFFSAIMTLKKMIYNPVHLSPPTPFSTPPPPISLEEITAISANAIEITKTSLKCASCNMCFTTLMNVGQLLGLLLRAYSQFLQTSNNVMPRSQAKKVVNDEMDKILDILGQVEIRSLARHGMVLSRDTSISKDMVGRGVIERIATGNWVGDRNPLCLKIVNMVRGLADGLICGVGVGECVNGGQCNSGLNTLS
ncbi:hypothetical protein TWF173_006908 [Orbilia oligospora]|uniref:Zn(2)-C6 fungal-type domain-containing protein n=2 Tax=Orbilia oligospora TaxID=2813651 RepID=A0A7C8RET3_ORBOL|nr:hypothetical protein TWF970_008824 [Orbilia oligospora]KAF3312684.1 hypothetical protein TWF173_006908 [Orbilia oligospora]